MNCKITENYFAEKARMTGATADNIGCMIKCTECPLSHCNNGENEDCSTLEILYTEKAVEIVQQWSDKHPEKTILDDLKEKYPNYNIGNDGVPSICPCALGYEEDMPCKKIAITCKDCWNRPMEEVKK